MHTLSTQLLIYFLLLNYYTLPTECINGEDTKEISKAERTKGIQGGRDRLETFRGVDDTLAIHVVEDTKLSPVANSVRNVERSRKFNIL